MALLNNCRSSIQFQGDTFVVSKCKHVISRMIVSITASKHVATCQHHEPTFFFAMIPGFGRVATPLQQHDGSDKVSQVYKSGRWKSEGRQKTSKKNVEGSLPSPVTLDDNKVHVMKCPDPSRCWRCLYLRNKAEWEEVASLKSNGHVIGTWLSLSKKNEVEGDNKSEFVGLSCLVCQKAKMDNNFAKGLAQFLVYHLCFLFFRTYNSFIENLSTSTASTEDSFPGQHQATP